MNNQEAFNIAYTRLIEQGQPSSSNSSCYYSRNGLKCAIGHLIPEDIAQKWDALDDSSISRMSFGSIYAAGLADCNVQFLTDLQDAHDQSRTGTFVDDFKAKASLIAEAWGLYVPE